ncbi:Z1 domain-containing protein [Bradyrhizobium sp. BR 1433]|uniref:Z1 domain-containing protein n=1 Tax=Bradyrhizobium sp. BR 1433 TaxID=3447967 RepID=UPI003EE558F6
MAATARAFADGQWPTEGFKHLSHSSPSIGEHGVVVNYIGRHLAEIRRTVRGDIDAAMRYFDTAYAELSRTITDPPALGDLVTSLRSAVEQQSIIVYNSAAELPQAPGPRVNFLVGGNILGRGLTIDDLLVTYYVREAKISQMDTVWQHARMYGYRVDLMPYTRVYVPRRVAANFRRIHDAEGRLRDQLRRDPQGQNPVIWVPRGTRATRPNALPSGYLEVVPSGTAQIHPARWCDAPAVALDILQILRREEVPVGENDRQARLANVPFNVTMELVSMVPLVDNDPGDWNPDAVAEILLKYREDAGEFGNIYVRRLNGNPDRSRARLSGNEVTLIRESANGTPTLVLLYRGDANAPDGWYPTLVMPENSPGFIFGPADE